MTLLTIKSLAIFFALATTAFCVSTVVLAVEKAQLENDLQDALDKLDAISTVTSTAAPSATTQTTESITTTPTGTAASTVSSAASVTATTTSSTETTRTTQGIAVPTITIPNAEVTPVSSNPNYPTLPTGLPDPEEITYRLPTEIRPVKYRIYWEPNFDTKTCGGYVTVQIEIDTPTNLIVMHAKDLEIEGVSILNTMAYLRIRVKSFYLSEEREMLFIELEELLSTGTPYTVNIEFTSQMSGLSGMYTSVYQNQENEET